MLSPLHNTLHREKIETNRRTNKALDLEAVDRWTDGWINRRTDRKTDRQTKNNVRWTDKQTDVPKAKDQQIDRLTKRPQKG